MSSDAANALAFQDKDYSFIGITSGLVDWLWDLSSRISNSARVTDQLGLIPPADRRQAVQDILCRTQLQFAVSHEYGHHALGHVSNNPSRFESLQEILCNHGNGSLASQAEEVEADSYAVSNVLANLISGGFRSSTLELLTRDKVVEATQDQLLLGLFVVAIGGYFFLSASHRFDPSKIYIKPHPPQAARTELLMDTLIRWSHKNRPALSNWMTLERFAELMSASCAAAIDGSGQNAWAEQTSYLSTEAGMEYFRKLQELVRTVDIAQTS